MFIRQILFVQGVNMKRTVSTLFTMAFAMTILAYSTEIYSQQEKSTDQKDSKSASKPDTAKSESNGSKELQGTYLDVAIAKENSIKYEDIIVEDIHKLQVIIANFGDANEKSTLETIQKDHLNGRKELFKRNYLKAHSILKNVRKQIQTLYQGLSERYQKKTNEILGRCADTIVEKEIGAGNQKESVENAAKTSRKITQNKIKLTIAYDQLNMADKFKFDERLADSLTHYRIAKLHGIGILVDMADSETDKNNIKNEFKADQMDSENQISK